MFFREIVYKFFLQFCLELSDMTVRKAEERPVADVRKHLMRRLGIDPFVITVLERQLDGAFDVLKHERLLHRDCLAADVMMVVYDFSRQSANNLKMPKARFFARFAQSGLFVRLPLKPPFDELPPAPVQLSPEYKEFPVAFAEYHGCNKSAHDSNAPESFL